MMVTLRCFFFLQRFFCWALGIARLNKNDGFKWGVWGMIQHDSSLRVFFFFSGFS